MSRNPVILEISHKKVKGIAYRSGVKGKTFLESNSQFFSSKDNAIRTEEIIGFIKDNYPENGGIYLNLPAENMFFREISLPFIERKKIKEILPFELESMISYELDEIVFDYYANLNLENNSTDVLIVGSLKAPLLPYINLFKQNNFQLKGIYAPHDALFHLFPYTGERAGVLIHVSSLMSYLVVIEDNRWVYSRILPIGYDILVSWLAQKWKKTKTESENLLLSLPKGEEETLDFDFYKKHFQVSRPQAKLFIQTIQEFGEDLAREISSSEKNIRSKTKTKPDTMPIYLNSELKNQTFLEDIISRKLKKEVLPFPVEKTPVSIFSRDYSVAVGAGIAQSSSKRMNFLSGNLKKESMVENKKSMGVILSAALGIFFFMASVFLEYRQKASLIDELREKQIGAFKEYFKGKTPDINRSLLAQAKEIVEKEKLNTEILKKIYENIPVSQILFELHQLIPSEKNIEIENINYDGKTLRLMGTIADFESLNLFETTLRESEKYNKVESSKRSLPAGKGTNTVKFTLTLEPKKESKEQT
ncbi:MAG: PilN domain-containing protein [Spirochaetia bacterium]|nr:PilN domain-containing protein [Spirochaetia bacterium]